ncbi:MAG: hypothetical protein R2800_06330 [Flavipsychrobacter sp.]
MSKRFLLISSLLVFAGTIGCTKKTVNNPVYPSDSGAFTYTVEGIKDTTLERVGSATMPILVKKLTGGTERVTFSQFDVPDGMDVTMEKSIEEPSFNTFIKITTTRTKVGKYPIRITAASPTTGITEYKMTVTVTDYTNEATGLKGTFEEKGNCSATGHDVNVVIASSQINRIIIRGFWQGTMTNEVYADLDRNNKTLSIPSQTVFGITFTGSGTYTDNEMVINYTAKGTTVNQTCTSTFTRK